MVQHAGGGATESSLVRVGRIGVEFFRAPCKRRGSFFATLIRIAITNFQSKLRLELSIRFTHFNNYLSSRLSGRNVERECAPTCIYVFYLADNSYRIFGYNS